MDDRATVAPEAGRWHLTRDGHLMLGIKTGGTGINAEMHDPDGHRYWYHSFGVRSQGYAGDDLIRLLPADWTPPPGWCPGDPLPEEPETYPVGITSADHIAHDMKMGWFPERSTVAAFLSQRAAPAPQEGVAEVVAAARALLGTILTTQQTWVPGEDRTAINVKVSDLKALLAALARLPAPPPSGEGDGHGAA